MGDAEITLVTSPTAAVPVGTSTWVALSWVDGVAGDEQFRVATVADQGVGVSYPTNTDDHSSLFRDDKLSIAEIDFTALKLNVPATATQPISLQIELSYFSDGTPVTEEFDVVVPLAGSTAVTATTDPTTTDSTVIAIDPANLYVTTSGERIECDIIGTRSTDVLVGTDADEVICGLGGKDTIDGMGGNDTIYGGAGNDTIYGGAGNGTINGGDGDDYIEGGSGNDELNGGEGDDEMSGGPANDTIVGGGGIDHANGGNQSDTCHAETEVSCEL